MAEASSTPQMERMVSIIDNASSWFVVGLGRKMCEARADSERRAALAALTEGTDGTDGTYASETLEAEAELIDGWREYPEWVSTSPEGVYMMREFLKELLRGAGFDASDIVVDEIRSKEVMSRVVERRFQKRYPTASPHVISIVHCMMSDMRMLAKPGRPAIDVQGHWHLDALGNEVGFSQLWFAADTAGRDGAMPIIVAGFYSADDSILVMVNSERGDEAMSILPHLWRSGWILRTRPRIVFTTFGDDAQDFATWYCPVVAPGPADTDFGTAFYES